MLGVTPPIAASIALVVGGITGTFAYSYLSDRNPEPMPTEPIPVNSKFEQKPKQLVQANQVRNDNKTITLELDPVAKLKASVEKIENEYQNSKARQTGVQYLEEFQAELTSLENIQTAIDTKLNDPNIPDDQKQTIIRDRAGLEEDLALYGGIQSRIKILHDHIDMTQSNLDTCRKLLLDDEIVRHINVFKNSAPGDNQTLAPYRAQYPHLNF